MNTEKKKEDHKKRIDSRGELLQKLNSPVILALYHMELPNRNLGMFQVGGFGSKFLSNFQPTQVRRY